MKKSLFIFLFVTTIFGLLTAASAHQPRLVYPQKISSQNPVVISNPDISQAFYGELKGEADSYRLELTQPMDFYIGLLSPDIADSKKDFGAEVVDVKTGEPKIKLDPTASEWKTFWEEYGGDNYFFGPEQTTNLPASIYRIKVYNPDNSGKYVLVVGQKESFSIGEVLATLVSLPRLKTQFFGEKPLAFFNGKVGKTVAIVFAVLAVLVVVIILVIKKVKKNKNKKQ